MERLWAPTPTEWSFSSTLNKVPTPVDASPALTPITPGLYNGPPDLSVRGAPNFLPFTHAATDDAHPLASPYRFPGDGHQPMTPTSQTGRSLAVPDPYGYFDCTPSPTTTE